jgi:hypothetical protein
VPLAGALDQGEIVMRDGIRQSEAKARIKGVSSSDVKGMDAISASGIMELRLSLSAAENVLEMQIPIPEVVHLLTCAQILNALGAQT